MPTHITARLAWHNDGWNGTVCRQPERNTYCTGAKSYPGDVIARERDLANEQRCAGCLGAAPPEQYVPPCSYSFNAFGPHETVARSNPPDFFYGGAEATEWSLAPATVCVWPYEAMYDDEVKAQGFLDNDRRRELTLKFFKPIEEDRGQNLVFYYANYSNPFSEEDAQCYVLIGVSRIQEIGKELFYENVSERIAERYAGGVVWARTVTSRYPEEGLRLPYHRYLEDPERLRDIAVFPEDPSLCKYGSKHLSDDDAIGLLEQLLAKVRFLREIGDDSENWGAREEWLLRVVAELWTQRGLYPGLLRALQAAGAEPLIEPTKAACLRHGHAQAHRLAFEALDGGAENELTASMDANDRRTMLRNWRLMEDDAQALLRDVLPRLDLSAGVMAALVSENRMAVGIPRDLGMVAANPYLLCERYTGEDASDRILWSALDRGVLPSPEVGSPLVKMTYNDERRFRALCVDHLKSEPKHAFQFGDALIGAINTRMARLPEWKQAVFNTRYFKADEDFLSESLTLKQTDQGLAVYLRTVFEDERTVEAALRNLVSRADVTFRRPVTDDDWRSWVYKGTSPLALKGGRAYDEAVAEQAEICARLFRRPLSVVTGPAGTGKTSVIEAMVRAVRRTEGEGASVLVLAPTGKAADRAREVFEKAALAGVETVTVHSFLASKGWLNDNLTFKRSGGKQAAIGTIVLDEASMLDLELAAALFRAVEWEQVRRLVLVGDAGQLPPIGRGRVFADIIKWMEAGQPEGLGRLRRNLRQLLNEIEGKGQSILALSELFILDDDDKAAGGRDAATRPDQEALIRRLHAGGTVDRDLEVIYWEDPTELAPTLIGAIECRMKGAPLASDERPHEVWGPALKPDPTAFQVLTPHRGELHGVEALNQACQKRVAENVISRVGTVGGITLFDKVIQIRNRPKSNMIWAYNFTTRQQQQVEVFNGEIGVVEPFGFDGSVLQRLRTGRGKRLSRFAVRFARKSDITVGYGKAVPHPGKWKRTEKVEDNLELAYAVSVHKAQGSEFAHTFVVIPAAKGGSVSPELVYTALTRATRHCTLLIERDVGSLLDARRRENAQTPQINSSLFTLHVVKPALLNRRGWYEAGKVHEALSGDMVRSKSEVIIANLLHQHQVPFLYEQLLFAGDGTIHLPDFTVTWGGETFYWEHLGLLDQPSYAEDWARKQAWYDRWFPGCLLTTQEGARLSHDAEQIIATLKSRTTVS
ncbi:AAA family ATPase [Azospirillum formosense]|nr:AAA family ATPase [Azospirillum formosense]